MRTLIAAISVAGLLMGCESLYQEDDGIRRIRSQRDVDEYNATVSSESQKLVCTREVVVGTHFRSFVCLTVAQRDRLSREARDSIDDIRASVGTAQ
jgi:hypothetical protein